MGAKHSDQAELLRAAAPVRYRARDLLVDVGRARVTRDDQEIPLPKLSLDLLIVLLRAAPNVVSLESLMELVWPGLVVSPETVTQRVKVLRSSLGDHPKEPRYIAGVRGRGYRIVCEVQTAESTAQVPATAPAPDVTLPAVVVGDQKRSLWKRAVFAAVVLLIAGVAVTEALRKLNEPAVAARDRVTVSALPPRSVAVLPFENLSTAPSGNTVALGMSEAVRHQLGNLDQLVVIARTSTSALETGNDDTRAIALRLNARYLLEGSVQGDESRLRVTAQLVDAATGAQAWSMRFDRSPQDIFAVQDEIAISVARALQLSLDASTSQRLAGRGTRNLGAWLAYEQARALIATRRIADLDRAKERLAEAIRADPSFAAAYVALAEAHVAAGFFQESEFWFGVDPQMSPAEKDEVKRLLTKALALDEHNGDAYLIRAWQEEDDTLAVPDFRRGLALSPNNAAGLERFARRLFRQFIVELDPNKRAEALVVIDRARKVDPLSPSGHLTKALMVHYGFLDWKQAIDLLMQALAQNPNYYPALIRLAEIKWDGPGELAEAAKYGEQALALEPHASMARHLLSRIYLDLGDFDAAREVIEESGEDDPNGRIPLLLYQHDWKRAGELAYASPPGNALDEWLKSTAVLRQARATGQFARARKIIEEDSPPVVWNANGEPTISPDAAGGKGPSVDFGEVLYLTHDRQRARGVLRLALKAMQHEGLGLRRGSLGGGQEQARALAMLGENDAAIETLQRGSAEVFPIDWWSTQLEPAYDPFRDDPRFKALIATERARIDKQRERLAEMRADGVVPVRTHSH